MKERNLTMAKRPESIRINSELSRASERALLTKSKMASETSNAFLLSRIARIARKPGIPHKVVFCRLTGKTIYAYSIFEKDPTQIVRIDAKGVRKIGKLINGRFRVTSRSTGQ
jgi:hypothetical protein